METVLVTVATSVSLVQVTCASHGHPSVHIVTINHRQTTQNSKMLLIGAEILEAKHPMVHGVIQLVLVQDGSTVMLRNALIQVDLINLVVLLLTHIGRAWDW